MGARLLRVLFRNLRCCLVRTTEGREAVDEAVEEAVEDAAEAYPDSRLEMLDSIE